MIPTARPSRLAAGCAALLVATLLWLPCLHSVFARPANTFRQPAGLSPLARQLAARQLYLWTNSVQLTGEQAKMRRTNAEWDFMGRGFLVWSLANMSLRDPASKTVYLRVMDQIIDETLRLEKTEGMCFFLMPYARAHPFVGQPAHSLFLDGEIALMLAARRTVAEQPEYKTLLTARLNDLEARLRHRPGRFLESYPDECWTFDHCVAFDAMKLADRLDGTDHSGLIRDWITLAKQRLVDPQSGLLISAFTLDGKPLYGPEGSTLWMLAHTLQLLDPGFARDQYLRTRKELGVVTLGFGYAHEWPASWPGSPDVDSGPIVPGFNLSAGSSGMAFIGASAFGDDAFLASLATTLNFAGFPSCQHGRLKYCASNQVGDTALLYAATLGPLWQGKEEPSSSSSLSAAASLY